MHLQDYKDKEFNNYEYIDKWILGRFQEMEKGFLKYLDEYEVGLALNHLEKFFWNFCDNYIEIVKHRLYRPEEFGDEARYSGQKTVYTLLYKLLQDFSIYILIHHYLSFFLYPFFLLTFFPLILVVL